VLPQRGAQKRKIAIFRPKVTSLEENLPQSAKIVYGGRPFYLKFWPKLTHPIQKRRFSIDIRSASAELHCT